MTSGAQLLIQCLKAHGVEKIFTVPGASIDSILDQLDAEIVLCRHEQNAAFMAANWGRITGQPGVCLATAGPGLTNLVTGIATADAERCPVVAITGQVRTALQFKRAHQNIDSVGLFRPITKWSVEALALSNLPDLVANAFRIAAEPREGPVHLSIPPDVLFDEGEHEVVMPSPIQLGVANPSVLDEAAKILNGAKRPVIFLGMAASKPATAEALRHFLYQFDAPIVATFEAAGAVSRELLDRFMGRLGLFRNQPGDRVLAEADAIISIGYDLVEYDPAIWNPNLCRKIVHIGEVPATVDQFYQPAKELIGDIGSNLKELGSHLLPLERTYPPVVKEARKEIERLQSSAKELDGTPIHPRRFIAEMREVLDDDVTVITDVGSHQYWMAQHFFCFEPRHFLTSMGFQTMGVSLPWAIATALARPGKPVVSVSGDGSFLMCSMELETAVRLKLPIVHIVWEEGTYNLVEIQAMKKYGRARGTHFGPVDTPAYAESMGATGMRIESPDQIGAVLKEAMALGTPVVIGVAMDYSDNMKIVVEDGAI
jgi:acetolactate synthase I/II/III large subunit